ncbi:MAG: hypothetical protein EOM50_07860 [Erysipelotrichia bacterium]|nr:hypothetical protein [Erysipelotrichia bacterium]
MNKISRILWGVVLIALGVILAINALNITYINLFFKGWWTLLIIIPCFISLFNKKDKTKDFIGLSVGILLLLGVRGYIHFYMVLKLLLPIILILIGLSIVLKDVFHRKTRKAMKYIKRSEEEYYSTFQSQQINVNKQDFKGCHLNAIFGELKCDLQEVIITQDCIVDVSAIFGSVRIYVADDVNVEVISTALFGSVDTFHKKNIHTDKPTLYINALCMFGGVDIK